MANKSNNDNIVDSFFIFLPIVIFLIIYIPFALFNAWIALNLYNWFILEPFHAPHLNIWHIWGVGLFIGQFNNKNPKAGDNSTKDAVTYLLTVTFAALISLIVGYFIKGLI